MFGSFVLIIICLCSHIGRFLVKGTEVALFSNFSLTVMPKGELEAMHESGPFGLGVLLIVVAILLVLAIMLFRKRMRQVRLLSLANILLVGYVATYVFLAWTYNAKVENELKGEDFSYQLAAAAVYPVVCFILNWMAIHAIRKDEALVRAAERFR